MGTAIHDASGLALGRMKIIATKTRRHKGFIFNKTFWVTLWLCVLVAIFMEECIGDLASIAEDIIYLI